MSYQGDLDLERAIYSTIRYFALFDMPVTAVQIWRALIVDREGVGVRWHGHQAPALADVRGVLAESQWLGDQVVSVWGYYCLRSEVGLPNRASLAAGGSRRVERYVRAWLLRHAEAQRKWKIARRVVRWLAPLPFVRMIGGSGSLALFNARADSDLDLFFVVRRGRIWTARLFLLLVSQLTGRRRKYWDQKAPDKVCLNHYITDDELAMADDVRNLYTAQLYLRLVPLSGWRVYKEWMAVNEVWIRRWLMYPEALLLRSRLYIAVGGGALAAKKLVEGWLLEWPGDVLERWAERLQRRAISQHTSPGRTGRVVVSSSELAFHPESKVPAVLARFAEDAGQRQLL